MKRLFQKNKKPTAEESALSSESTTPNPNERIPSINNTAFSPICPPLSNISGFIGYNVSQPVLDIASILSLSDYISTSTSASKDCARALRKELKYGSNKESSLRLLSVLMRNSDVRFKTQIAEKRFLDEVLALATDKKTSIGVVELIIEVFSPLAYEYQRDADLSSITQLYNKIKPASLPLNGSPLDHDDPSLIPTSNPNNQPRSSRSSKNLPSNESTIKNLRLEAETARQNASMLTETISFCKLSELTGNELIKEFFDKCFRSSEIISQNLEWISVQAEQSRPSPQQPVNHLPPSHLGSNNPFAPAQEIITEIPPIPETEAEITLAQCLLANSEVFDALALHTTRFNALREEVEFQNTQERSKSDLRYDRSTAQDSGYQVPPPVQTTEDSLSESTARLSMNPYAAYLKPSSPPASPPPASNNPHSHLAATTAPESNYNFDFVDSGNSQFQTNSYSVSGQYDNSDHIDQPVERSEKSKGKGRSASYSLKE